MIEIDVDGVVVRLAADAPAARAAEIAATHPNVDLLTTLSDPMGTHPHLHDHPVFSDPRLISGIFGWMMLYLAILTVNLAWHGWLCINNRRNHRDNRAWHNLLSQGVLTLAATACAFKASIWGKAMGESSLGTTPRR